MVGSRKYKVEVSENRDLQEVAEMKENSEEDSCIK